MWSEDRRVLRLVSLSSPYSSRWFLLHPTVCVLRFSLPSPHFACSSRHILVQLRKGTGGDRREPKVTGSNWNEKGKGWETDDMRCKGNDKETKETA